MTQFANVITLPNIYNQHKVDEYLNYLIQQPDGISAMKFAFISEAVAILESTNPDVIKDQMIEKGVFSTTLKIEVDGTIYEKHFKLIKQIVGYHEIFEIRLDYTWQKPSTDWYLRIFFFKYTYNNELYYCFAEYLEKDAEDLVLHNKKNIGTIKTNARARQVANLRTQMSRNFKDYELYFSKE